MCAIYYEKKYPKTILICVFLDVVPDSLVLSVNTWIHVFDHNVRMEQHARARCSMVSHSTLVCAREGSEVCLKECICTGNVRSYQVNSKYQIDFCSLFDSQAKTAPSLMLVRQVPVPTEPDVSIGITIITVPVRLASKERTAAMTLTSAASLVFASMVEPA